ncbi:sulfotransferase [Egicoccus sp. AB-alg2]|uniref:sulfotransferase family protein n=1 Tax=Egicoccus sp. AB-alg2 TaxID=3242693 RepID=UPI00359ED16D
MQPGPVFVAGQERSGTSLLYALLASHPNLAMTRRTNLWRYFYGQYGDLADPANLERCLTMLLRYRRIAVLDVDGERLRSDFLRGEATYARLFWLVEQQVADRLGKPRWGDKSLDTERFADPIMAAYRGARILHMIRDPRDRYASVLVRWKSRRGDVGAGTAAWLASVALGERHQRRYPAQYRIVRYETLVQAPERTLREICDFIGEPYRDGMLGMAGASRFRDDGGNSSYGPRTVGVISADSIGRYREVLSPRQIAFIDRVAAAPMARMGYLPEPLRLTPHDRLRFSVADRPVNTGALLAWRARAAYVGRTGQKLPAYRLLPEAGAR